VCGEQPQNEVNMGRSDLLWTPTLWVALVLAAGVSASGVRADPRDYHLEVERELPGGHGVVVLLVNDKQNRLTPGALITGSALIGPIKPADGGKPTMASRVTAQPIRSEGRYLVTTEAGMTVFTLRLNAKIENESQSIDSILDARCQHWRCP